MLRFHPSPRDVIKGAFTFHSEAEYVKLIAANMGAVVMPWMIYFQQSAVVARHLVTREDFLEERKQTFAGSVLTQLVMIGTLVTLAASRKSSDLETVADISYALSPVLGSMGAKVLVSLGFMGGSLCAAFVVSLAASWAVCEAMDMDVASSLDESPLKAPYFYGSFLIVISIGTVVLLSGVNVVQLNIVVELLDGILLPFAVGFLFLLAVGEALPAEARVVGVHKLTLAVIFSICTVLSLGTAVYGLLAELHATGRQGDEGNLRRSRPQRLRCGLTLRGACL
eukprot:CAMPEP_0171065476 /NCGR_PEP_ID=MMETSP0766_2-20121228/6868_1 /TAXON_ID=439317 /ORGANISM="Gambierdiscus australes, Strain CAWD 149" /LENGTH=281 /DNA_ID=CAMNT_0011521581 /DNA_START=14 /DNA_END=857 /DNA_ORIENTATION=-